MSKRQAELRRREKNAEGAATILVFTMIAGVIALLAYYQL